MTDLKKFVSLNSLLMLKMMNKENSGRFLLWKSPKKKKKKRRKKKFIE
jgi:hypothetical protein